MFRLYWVIIRPSKGQIQCIKIYSAFWDPKRVWDPRMRYKFLCLTEVYTLYGLDKHIGMALNAELNPICHLLALLGAHPIFHVSRIRVKLGAICTQRWLAELRVLQRRNTFLSAFAKLRKATIRFVMPVCPSVRPSVRMEHLGSHCTDFYDILYLSTFRNMFR